MPLYKHVKVFSVAFYKVGSFRIPSLTLILFSIVHVRQAHQHFTLSVTFGCSFTFCFTETFYAQRSRAVG